jgi:8-oxo-dGTP pyrophosphatase MutT (NUDIX family)
MQLCDSGAGIIICKHDGSVLLVRGLGPGKWSFPKGQSELCDCGPLATAVRECFEETGLQHGRDYELIYCAPFTCFDRTYFFARLNDGAESNIQLEAEEVSDYRWLDPRKSCHYWFELNSGVRSYVKAVQEWI